MIYAVAAFAVGFTPGASMAPGSLVARAPQVSMATATDVKPVVIELDDD